MSKLNPIEVPQFNDDRECAEFINKIKAKRKELADIEKTLKAAEEKASNYMLDRLSATGQKHFAFTDCGTFTRVVKNNVSFATAENGGREASNAWIEMLIKRGVISFNDAMYIHQARLTNDAVLSIEEAVATYNQTAAVRGEEQIPASPFNHYETVSLSVRAK